MMDADDDESLSPHLLTHGFQNDCFMFVLLSTEMLQLCATSINKMGGYTGMEVPMHQAGNRTEALLLSWLMSWWCCENGTVFGCFQALLLQGVE